jgi:hypothetical protein
VLPAESVGEGEAGGELLGFYQKPGAVGDPWVGCFQEWLNSVLSSQFSVLSFQFWVMNGQLGQIIS